MGLADTVAQHQKPLTPRYVRYLNEMAGQYNEDALAFGAYALSGARPERRRRLLNASQATWCMRQRMFEWLRMEGKTPPTPELQNTFEIGSFMHLKFQMAGLTEGFLVEVERDMADYDEDHCFGARIDGVGFDGRMVEYKSARPDAYKKMVDERRPAFPYTAQTHYALILSDEDEASIVVENKGTGEWTEFPIRRSEYFTNLVLDEVDAFALYRKAKELPPRLPACQAVLDNGYGKAPICGSCPFAGICPTAEPTEEQWTTAAAIKEAA